jgi:hypothetical protein
MGHDSETATQIHISAIDAIGIDRANARNLKSKSEIY